MVSINELDIEGSLLNQTDQKAVRVIYLPIKENFLIGFCMIVDIGKDLGKLFIRILLIFQLLQFHAADTFKQGSIIGYEAAHFNKSAHDRNADVHGNLTMKNACQHGDALFCIGVRHCSSATVSISF